MFSCTLPVVECESFGSDFNGSTAKLSSYPPIFIKREVLIGSSQSRFNTDRRILMTPLNEPLSKRLTRIYFEDGLTEALTEAEQKTQDYKVVNAVFRGLRFFLEKAQQLNSLVWPYSDDRELNHVIKYSQTRDWLNSPIRCMRWHPNVFKVAVAAVDDIVRIYSNDLSNPTALKNGHQKCITSLAWRPLSAGELAVGCNNGIIIWKLDHPGSSALRQILQFVHLKRSNHHPISSLEWNRTGALLVSASVTDPNVIVWDVDTGRNIPLKRIGLPCALVHWSPNNQRLFTSTIGSVFRVWETNKWTPERWTVPTGSIQSAAWSPCSNQLLFVTTNEPILYSLCFIEEQLYKAAGAPKQTFPIANFAQIQTDRCEIGGLPKSIAWDPTGKCVAVIFKLSTSIALFSTSIHRNALSISPKCYVDSGDADEFPSYICFQEVYSNKNEIILTIGWSTGRVQYLPIS